MSRKFWLLSLVIIIFSLSARLLWLTKTPVSLYWDETAILADARAIRNTGSDLHGEGIFKPIYYSYGDYKMPLYIIFTTSTAFFTGANELAVRLPNMVIGVLTLLVAGYLSVQLFEVTSKKNKAFIFLLTLFIATITPWHFHFSRVGFEAFAGQFFVALSLAILFTKLPDKYKLLLSPLIGALGVYSYFSVRFVWPVVFIGTLLFMQRKKKPPVGKDELLSFAKGIVPSALIGLLVFGLLLLPMALSDKYQASNELRYSTRSLLNDDSFVLESNVYRELSGNTPIDRVFFHRELLRTRKFVTNFATHLSPNYLFTSGDNNLRHGTGESGLLLLAMAPLFAIGLLSLIKNKKTQALLLILWWFIALVPASVPYEVPHGLRSLNALVPLVLFTSFGLYTSIRFIAKRCKLSLAIGLSAIVVGSLLLEFSLFAYQYFGNYPIQSASDWQSGHKQVANAVYKHKSNNMPVYVINADDRLYLWFLANGPYSSEQFISWQDQLKTKPSFDNIHFNENPNWQGIPKNTLIVTTKSGSDTLLSEISTAGRKIVFVEDILDTIGNPTHTILMLE